VALLKCAPTRLKLAINTKAAQALGLRIPETLLARVDDLVERELPGSLVQRPQDQR
jgi:hypothetical protein